MLTTAPHGLRPLVGRSPGRGRPPAFAGTFNPDFFLLTEAKDEVVIVETKDDKDVSDVNRGELAHALDYVDKLNELLQAAGETRRYQFHILSPVDYDDFLPACATARLTALSPACRPR